MLKKLISVAVSACMLLGTFTGCNSAGTPASPDTSTPEASSEPAEAASTPAPTPEAGDTAEDSSAPEAAAQAVDDSAAAAPEGIKTGGILRIVTGQNPSVVGYTPEITPNSHIQFLRAAYDSLLFYNEAGELISDLAESWEVDSEAATITFKLKEGVKFSDGTDFNAEAVKWNMELYKSVGRTEVGAIDTIECPDAYTVKITLSSWVSSALESIGVFVFYMSPTAVQENGEDWARQNSSGTGPFVVDSFELGVSVKYKKNENYWEPGKPYLDGIEYTIMSDATTIQNTFIASEADMISYASLEQRRDLSVMDGVVVQSNQNGVGAEAVGVIPSSADENSPFSDARVRQAFCYAIDTDTIVESLGYGLYTRTNQWAAPSAATFNPDVQGYPYNPDKAKELLAEAGYADGFDTVFFSAAGMETWASAVCANLQAVGIRATVELIDAARGNDIMANGWEGIYYHFASIGPDLGLYMGRHLDVTGAYYAKGIQHPQDTLDLLKEIREATDEDAKLAAEFELQEKIYDEYALFGEPLYVQLISNIKYDYVMDDNFTRFQLAAWTPENAWLNK